MNECRKASLVSVIIPTYNRARLLPETMDSVLAQTYRPIEVVVVDDGSTDNTQQILQTWCKGCPGKGEFEVRYFYQPNKGPSSARNLGFAESKGEFILYLDSDDLLLPEKLALQAKELNAGFDACVSGAKWMDANGHVFFEDMPSESPSADPLDDYLQCKTRPWPEVWLFRRSLLESGLSWNTSLFGPEDSLYVFEILAKSPRIKHVARALSVRRAHPGHRVVDSLVKPAGLNMLGKYSLDVGTFLLKSGRGNEDSRRIFTGEILRLASRIWWSDRAMSRQLSELACDLCPQAAPSFGILGRLAWRLGGTPLTGSLWSLRDLARRLVAR